MLQTPSKVKRCVPFGHHHQRHQETATPTVAVPERVDFFELRMAAIRTGRDMLNCKPQDRRVWGRTRSDRCPGGGSG